MTSAPQPIRILVVDDHFVVRSGLVASLGMEMDLEVVGEADSGEQALLEFRRVQANIVLMDLRLQHSTGIEVTAALCKEYPDVRVLMFTTFDGDEDVYQAMRAGARGYLLKSAPRDELLLAIRTVAAGNRYLPPELASRLADRVAGPDLTPRESEVLQLIGQGKSNKEIGALLFISGETVKRHVTHLLAKLGVADRAQATTEAIRRGFLRI